jgi:hypothetical protein
MRNVCMKRDCDGFQWKPGILVSKGSISDRLIEDIQFRMTIAFMRRYRRVICL